MGTTIDFVLSVIRAHPEGISTKEIAEKLSNGCAMSSKVCKAFDSARKLETFGLVTHEVVYGPGKYRKAIWRPVE